MFKGDCFHSVVFNIQKFASALEIPQAVFILQVSFDLSTNVILWKF